MEKVLKKRLVAREANEWDLILHKLSFLQPDAPFIGIIWADTVSLQIEIKCAVAFFCNEKKIKHKTIEQNEVLELDDDTLTIILLKEETTTDRFIKKINQQRDYQLQKNKKILFIAPLITQEHWYTFAYDWLSRTSVLLTLHDLAKYDSISEIATFTDNANEITVLLAEFKEIQKHTKNINRVLAISYRLYELKEYTNVTRISKWLLKQEISKEEAAFTFQIMGRSLEKLGQFEEAMKLYKKQEGLCKELDNKEGLAASYSNQGALFFILGRLEEAMQLHKKQEEIYITFDNAKQALANSYGNQAIILIKWERLEEAMDLLKKAENTFEKYNNKKDLANSYGNQAVILKKLGRLEEAMQLHKKEEKLKEELNYKEGLADLYGNQANILIQWERLEEAMELYKKQEKIYEEFNDKHGLATSYFNQGKLRCSALNQPKEGIILLKKSFELAKEIGNSQLMEEITKEITKFSVAN